MDRKQFETSVRARSHQIREREGRSSGHDKDYLARARAEIETEWHTALHDETGAVVPPQLPITQRPVRHHA